MKDIASQTHLFASVKVIILRRKKIMKKKVLMAMITALCLVSSIFVFTGCGEDSSEKTASGDTITIRLASDETKDVPISKATEIFEKEVEENSGGTMQVEYYSDSAIGDEKEIAESINMGNLEMGTISAAYMAAYDPNWYSIDLPYVFEDRETMYSMVDGEYGKLLSDGLSEKSKIKCLDFADGSFNIVLNVKKPITKVSDMAGLKIRTMDSQMNTTIYNAWGSTATPMGMSEVYTALQQGTIDGVDTSPLAMVSNKFQELGKYYTISNHKAMVLVSVINEDFFHSLTEEQQQIILDASQKAYKQEERNLIQDAEKESFGVLDQAGVKKTELSKSDVKTFKDASKSVYDAYSDKVDKKLYELLGL